MHKIMTNNALMHKIMTNLLHNAITALSATTLRILAVIKAVLYKNHTNGRCESKVPNISPTLRTLPPSLLTILSSNLLQMSTTFWLQKYFLIFKQEAFEKCWAHSPQRAAARRCFTLPFTRCCMLSALSMSTTTTTTRDTGDRYGPIEWAQQ